MFTDIEGSTRLLSGLGDHAFSGLLEAHHSLVRDAITSGGGVEVATEGDSFLAVLADSVDAVVTASHIQRQLISASWNDSGTVHVRIGLHSGTGVLGGDDYVGVDVHRARRISDAGHGGQVV